MVVVPIAGLLMNLQVKPNLVMKTEVTCPLWENIKLELADIAIGVLM